MSLTTATCSTQNWNNYNYSEPDIFNEMLAIEPQKDAKKGISPQDEYISKIALKDFLNINLSEPQISSETQNKINKEKADFVVGIMKRIKSKLINLDKHSDSYLIKYLDKTEEEQKNEAELAFSALASKWTKEEMRRLLSKCGNDRARACDLGELHNRAIQRAPDCINRLTPWDMENSQPKEYLVKDEKEELVIRPVFKKMNEIISSLNVLVLKDAASEFLLVECVREQETALLKLQEQDLPKLNERIEHLEYVSTHIIHGLNEEVQKLSEKSAGLEYEAANMRFLTDHLENEIKCLKNEIAGKETKIAQLASKVDAFQEEILEVKAVNQAQAKTIQEFQERQMKMEEEQKRQSQLLESLLKIQIEAEKKEQTAK